jgi:hypothetical protein
LLSSSALISNKVTNSAGESLGRIAELMFDYEAFRLPMWPYHKDEEAFLNIYPASDD